MDQKHLVVSFVPEGDQRKLICKMLDGQARISFLSDLPAKERRDAISGADILFTFYPVDELKEDEFKRIPREVFIQVIFAGVNHVPFDRLPATALIAGNAGAYAEPMAEHVLGMVLSLAKRLGANHEQLKRGFFEREAKSRSLRGRVCGILGFGGVGHATARLMRCLGMKIYAVNTSGKTDTPVDYIGTMENLQHVLHSSDVVLISLPLNKSTRNLLGRKELSWMKPDAILINVARGDIVDEKAVFDHMKENPDFCMGIDTWWDEPATRGEYHPNYPFFDFPNFLGTPHNSGIVAGIMNVAVVRAMENVLRFLRNEPVAGVVHREDYIDS